MNATDQSRPSSEHTCTALLPEVEARRGEISKELDSVRSEREKLSSRLLGAGLTAQAIAYVNGQVDLLSEQESRLQERLRAAGDEIKGIQAMTYNSGTCG